MATHRIERPEALEQAVRDVTARWLRVLAEQFREDAETLRKRLEEDSPDI